MADTEETKQIKALNLNVKAMADGLKKSVDKAASSISGHVSEVLSDEIKETTSTIKAGYDSVKDGLSSMKDFFGIELIERNPQTKAVKKGNEYLEEMLDIQKFMFYKQLAGLGKGIKKGGGLMWAILSAPLLLLAAGLGTIAALVFKPFQLLFKMVPGMTKVFEFLSSFFKLKSLKSLHALTKGASMGPIGRAFAAIGRLFVGMRKLSKLPFIRHILGAFKFGFNKLFWPIQIILSTIDFVKGFQSEQGDVFEKVKAGIKNVLIKFFEWPITFLGDLFGNIVEKMGFKMDEAGGDKAMEMFSSAIDKFFALPRWWWDTMKSVDWDKFWMDMGDMIRWFFGLAQKIKDFGHRIANDPVGLAKDLGKKLFKGAFTRPEDMKEGDIGFGIQGPQEQRTRKRLEEQAIYNINNRDQAIAEAQLKKQEDTYHVLHDILDAIKSGGAQRDTQIVPIPQPAGTGRQFESATTPDIDNAAYGTAGMGS